MICDKCKKAFEEIEEHHIIPKFMDNPKGLGNKINLCRKCHIILHLKIQGFLWNKMPENIQWITKNEIEGFTSKYLIEGKILLDFMFDKETEFFMGRQINLQGKMFLDRFLDYLKQNYKNDTIITKKILDEFMKKEWEKDGR